MSEGKFQQEKKWNSSCLEICLFNHFRTLSGTFSTCCPKYSDRVSEITLSKSVGTFWDKFCFLKNFWLTFLDIEQKLLVVFFKFVRQGCQNRNQRDHWNILRRIICFWQKRLVTFFGHSAKRFWSFVKFSSDGNARTAFHVTPGTFWLTFSTKSSSFFVVSGE